VTVSTYLVIDARVIDDYSTFENAIGPAWAAIRALLHKEIAKNGGYADVVAVQISATPRQAADLVSP
jgi:hypothetical protein